MAVGLIVLFATLLFSRVVDAAPASRLVYARPSENAVCPDEVGLRSAVRSRLGYDPFFPWADQTVVVQITPRPSRRLRGKVYLVDVEGRASAEREFTTSASECEELVQTLALAIAITLDPLYGATSKSAQGPPGAAARASQGVPEPPDAAPAGQDRPESPKAPEAPVLVATETTRADTAGPSNAVAGSAPPMHLELGVGAIGAVEMMPGISAGAAPFLRVRRGRSSFAVEGRFERLAWTDEGDNQVTMGITGVSVVPCYHLTYLAFCWPVLYGRYHAEGVAARPGYAPFIAVGIRMGAEIPLSTATWAFFRIDALANMSRHEFILEGGTPWQVPLWSLTLSAGAVASIL